MASPQTLLCLSIWHGYPVVLPVVEGNRGSGGVCIVSRAGWRMRRSHGSMTSKWKLQGLDMFQGLVLGRF